MVVMVVAVVLFRQQRVVMITQTVSTGVAVLVMEQHTVVELGRYRFSIFVETVVAFGF